MQGTSGSAAWETKGRIALHTRPCAGRPHTHTHLTLPGPANKAINLLEAVIGALVWDVRGFGDNGQLLERDKVSGFKKLLSGFWRTHRYFCCLHHWVSTASFASFHLHLTSTHRLCCQLRLVEFFELNGRVHTSTRDRPLGSALGVATFINQFRLLKVLCYPQGRVWFSEPDSSSKCPFFLLG